MTRLFLVLTLAALTLSGCRSSKNLADASSDAANINAEAATAAATLRYAEKVTKGAQKAEALTARIKMELRGGGKDMGLSGTLRMKRGEVIRLSLTMLGFEVGRIEFTPREVLIVDRVNTQFVRADYSDVSFLRNAALDFYTLEALFWNELFTPGNRQPQLERFTMASEGKETRLALNDAPLLDYYFFTDTAEARITRVAVEKKNEPGKAGMEWKYDKFTALDGRQFPSYMACNLAAEGRNGGFAISLSRLNNKDDWDTHTALSAKYKQRNADDILRQLLKH